MVTIPGEFEACRTLLDESVCALQHASVPARRPPLGIMVEVPAAAIAIDQFEAEFYSIGTNDLTACVTAAGRDVGATVVDALRACAAAAARGAAATAEMHPRLGRSSYLGARTLGIPDGGAVAVQTRLGAVCAVMTAGRSMLGNEWLALDRMPRPYSWDLE